MKVVNTLPAEEAQWKPIIKSQSFVFRIVRHVYNLHENTQSNKIISIKIEMLNSNVLFVWTICFTWINGEFGNFRVNDVSYNTEERELKSLIMFHFVNFLK